MSFESEKQDSYIMHKHYALNYIRFHKKKSAIFNFCSTNENCYIHLMCSIAKHISYSLGDIPLPVGQAANWTPSYMKLPCSRVEKTLDHTQSQKALNISSFRYHWTLCYAERTSLSTLCLQIRDQHYYLLAPIFRRLHFDSLVRR